MNHGQPSSPDLMNHSGTTKNNSTFQFRYLLGRTLWFGLECSSLTAYGPTCVFVWLSLLDRQRDRQKNRHRVNITRPSVGAVQMLSQKKRIRAKLREEVRLRWADEWEGFRGWAVGGRPAVTKTQERKSEGDWRHRSRRSRKWKGLCGMGQEGGLQM